MAAAKAWPFVEARRLLARTGGKPPASGRLLFEAGYGPSGLPHIGTFCEAMRPTMVRQAVAALSDIPTELVMFSDDMDGLRAVPANIPDPDRLTPHLGKPLTRVPDPFGCHASFADHNNRMLCDFLDTYGFSYTFLSATECYRSGRFDAELLRILAALDTVTGIIRPTLGPERRATYSPVMPICPRTGVVLQVPVREARPESGTIVYDDPETGAAQEVPVTGGHCKLQWKADWAMRWMALGVDYEMAGKDLIDSVRLSGRICRALDRTPPDGLIYEHFLDEDGRKISKSRGNGVSFNQWLRYGPPESLALAVYQKPRTARRLSIGAIPKAVDEYLAFSRRYPAESLAAQIDNPVWHIHAGAPPLPAVPVSYALLLNLVAATGSADKAVIRGFVARTAPDVTPDKAPFLDRLIDHAMAYDRDFVAPARRYRPPDDRESAAMQALADTLRAMPADTDAETAQQAVYETGKAHGFSQLRDWFQALYEVLLGQSRGPRFGSFAALYGLAETAALIEKRLAAAPDRPGQEPA